MIGDNSCRRMKSSKETIHRINGILTGIRSQLEINDIPYINHAMDHLEETPARRLPTFDEHIRALIYSLLSNQTKWINIAPKLPLVDSLFFGYAKGKIFEQPASYFYEGLFALKCGNISTRKQMEGLHENIRILEKIEREHGSLNDYYASMPAEELAVKLSSGPYKLKMVGYALACNYLKNLGIDSVKPDVHLRRILGCERLGFSTRIIATEREVMKATAAMSVAAGISKTMVNNLLWSFCADGYGQICRSTPQCGKCGIKPFCRYSPKVKTRGK